MHATSPPRLVRWSSIFAAVLAATLILATPSFAAQLVGMQTHLMWSGVDATEVNRQLDAAKGAGATIVRVDAGWSQIEANGKGQWNAYHLGRLDNVIKSAEARGLKVLLTFWQTPCWASSAPADLKQDCTGSWWDRGVQRYTPTNPQDYADGLAYVVRRYGTRVAGYEIWNEPNASSYYKSTDPVRDYAALLKAAYPAAKAANPNVKVVGGSLMWADYNFTQKLYAAGVKGSFDAWSIHPYSDDRSPLDPHTDAYKHLSFIRGVPAVRDVLLSHGDDKPLWLTEFGWHTSTIRNQEPWRNGVSEETQATYVGQALEQISKWPYVEAGMVFQLKNMGTDPGSRSDNFGITRFDLSPKPAYAAFRAGAATVAAADQTGTPGGDTVPSTDTTPPPAPSVSPASGTYSSPQSVTMSEQEAGTTIRYTAGTAATVPPDPTATTGTVYSGPVAVGASQVVKVAAFDAAGNRSMIVRRDYTVMTQRKIVVAADADAMAMQARPATNFGTANPLGADRQDRSTTGSAVESFLRFEVPALRAGESISRAELSLVVRGRTDNGPAIYRTSTSWSESALTWNARPPRASSTPMGNFGALRDYGRSATPLSGIVTSDAVSLQLVPESTDGLDFASREDGGTATTYDPQLVLTVSAS